MPWKMSDALGHTKKASSIGSKRQWAATANAVLKASGDEGKAVRVANAAVAESRGKKPAAGKSKPGLKSRVR